VQLSRRAVQYQDWSGCRAAVHGSDQDLSHSRRRREGLHRGVSNVFAKWLRGATYRGAASVRDRVSKYYYLQRSAVVNKPSICARALKSREIRSDLVECDFVEVKVANGPWPAVRCFARLPVPPNLCLPARVQHSAEKRIFVMAITSRGQGRR
jgi:hypothetical protein